MPGLLLGGQVTLATTIAAPLGSFLGQYIGWRGAFFAVVPLAALTLAWLFMSLPPMPSQRSAGGGTVFRVLRRPHVPTGMAAVTLFFLGNFALYTYLRPFLETVTQVNVSTLSLLLLLLGVAGLVGASVIGFILQTQLYCVLIVLPLGMAVIALALTALGGSLVQVGFLLIAWGLLSSAAPVGWWLWLSRVLPDDAEAGGGLMVAVIQLAIALGATAGGFLYDTSGYQSTFVVSAVALCISALLAVIGWLGVKRKA